MAFWSTKAAISLKRVKIEKKLLWGAYRNSPSLFRTVQSPTHNGLPFSKIGDPTSPKTPIAIISGTGKSTNFKFGQNNNGVHSNKSPWKILDKRERGHIQGLPKFFGYPLLSQEREKLRISNLASTFKQKPIKNFGEKGGWSYPGTAKFSWVPPIISGTGKAKDFKFG